MGPFYGWDSTASRLQSHYEEALYFLPLSYHRYYLHNLKNVKNTHGGVLLLVKMLAFSPQLY